MLFRGVWHRAGRSGLVLVLAAVAVAAAVLAPGYSRAAQQSVLTDRLGGVPAAATGLTVVTTGTAAQAPAAHQPLPETRLAVDSTLARYPLLAAALAAGVGGLDTDTTLTGGSEPVSARLAYRDGVCGQLEISGQCPAGPGEALVSERTTAEYGLAVGDRIRAGFPERSQELTVVGVYRPGEAADPYWGRTVYFAHGGFDPATGAPRVDAVFTGDPADPALDPAAEVTLGLTYPLRTDAVRLDDAATLRAELTGFQAELRAAGFEPATALPALLEEADRDRDALARAVPVLAVPLLLLAWFVLFLLVAAVIEERGREIGLAKLRGFSGGRAARFGLGEVLSLVALAAPVGFGLGLATVELVARLGLAEGTGVELRWPVLASAGAAVLAAVVAALLAARGTLRRGTLELLRRVPRRGRWRAGIAEGALVALALASLLVALGDPDAPLALLTPGLLAVVAGVVAARSATLLAAWRLRRAGRRGRLPGLLAAAQLARRPTGRRVVAVGTVAVTLLSFAAVAWDVAAQARREHAAAGLGAERVYTVRADHPAALAEAVRAADPGGTAMAVARASQQYAGGSVELLAVDAARLPEVVTWHGEDGQSLARLAAALRPGAPPPLPVGDRIEVTAEVSDLGDQPVRLTALVSPPGGPPGSVSLGTLSEQTGRYGARAPECVAGCRLLGFGLGRTGAGGGFSATVTVTGVRSGGEQMDARFDDPLAWHAPAGVSLTGGSALTVAVGDGQAEDVLLEYRDTPPAVPAVLAGAAPADDPAAAEFRFPGLGERPEPFAVVDRVGWLPRAGERGLLLDLHYAAASAERGAALADRGLRYEVWVGPGAPADLAQRLGGQGVAVLTTESIDATVDQLAERGPALGLRLGLLAAGLAVALAVGVVALSSRVGRAERRADLAALRVAGVPVGVLRRALWREYAALAGWPLLAGSVAGLATAALLLPGMALVETGVAGGLPEGWPALRALPVGLAVTGAGLLLAAWAAARLSTPDRPGEGS